MTEEFDGRSGRILSGVRICVDARYLNRPGVGINQYLRDALAALTSAGAHLVLLTDAPLPAESNLQHGTVVELRGSGILWEQWHLLRHLRKQSYDIYLAPANRGLPLLYGGNTLMAITVHDLIPLLLPRSYLWRKWRFAASYLVSQVGAIFKSDMIFAVSSATADDVARIFRRPAIVAPNNPPSYCAHHQSARIDIDVRGPYFLYNGGLDVRKRVDVLIAAFAEVCDELPEHRLVLMGNGYDGLLPTIRRLGLQDRVVLTGYVPEAEKYSYLRQAEALVYPSMFEGYGLPIVEGFAAGTPVITSGGGALSEVGGDAVLKIDPTSSRSIARAMVRIGDPDLRDQLTRLGERQLSRLASAAGPQQLVRHLAELMRLPCPAVTGG